MTKRSVPTPIDQRGNESHGQYTIERRSNRYYVISKRTGALKADCATHTEALDTIDALHHGADR